MKDTHTRAHTQLCRGLHYLQAGWYVGAHIHPELSMNSKLYTAFPFWNFPARYSIKISLCLYTCCCTFLTISWCNYTYKLTWVRVCYSQKHTPYANELFFFFTSTVGRENKSEQSKENNQPNQGWQKAIRSKRLEGARSRCVTEKHGTE